MATILTSVQTDEPGRTEQSSATGRERARCHVTRAPRVIGPDRPSRPQVDGMRGGDAHDARRHGRHRRRRSARPRRCPCLTLTCAPSATPSWRAGCRCIRACGGLRVGGLLQRRRAAHQRIGEVDRNVGDALDAGARCRTASRSRRRVPLCEARRDAGGPPAAVRRARRRSTSKSKPGRPSIEPSTRSTFQPGRVSPSGLHDAVEALQRGLRN